MTTIYCITEWDNDMKQTKSELFMSIDGLANWLINKNPVDNSFNVKDGDSAGNYDITAENLAHVLEISEQNCMSASFTIKQDFFIQIIETRFTLSTINVND